MKSVDIQNLQSELDKIQGLKLVAVILWTKDCDNCTKLLEVIEAIEHKYPKWIFFKTEVVDMPPLFSPPGLPSINVFFSGIRHFEGVGYNPQDIVEKIMRNWQITWEHGTGQVEYEND